MNGLWMKSVAMVAAMMGVSALAAAGTPARPRSSRAVAPARARATAGVWDDTDISHAARPNALRAQLAPIRDGTSNTLRAQARPARLADDSVGAGVLSPRDIRAGKALGQGGWGLANGYDSAGDDTLAAPLARPRANGMDADGDFATSSSRPVGIRDGTSNTLKPRPVGLYDSPGDDTSAAPPKSARIIDDGDHGVTARHSRGALGAGLYDSPGNDTLTSGAFSPGAVRTGGILGSDTPGESTLTTRPARNH